MNAPLMSDWFQAFALTQLVEVPIYLTIARHLPIPRRWLIALGASTLTHPVVWWMVLSLPGSYQALVIGAEAFAVLAEAAWGRAMGLRRPLLASLVANSASVLTGIAWRGLAAW